MAEGVEDEDTMNELTRLGCNIAQGFHVSRPLPPAEFASWLADRGERRLAPVRTRSVA